MKRLILSGLSVLLATALYTPVAKAEFTVEPYMVQPVNLVFLGYQGYFEQEGIPSNGRFIEAIHSGKVNSTTLVESAIKQGRLPEDTINNKTYLNNVQMALISIDHD
jgi:hypothetical protein